MMSGTNPRPEFMSKLKTFCKNVEGEVKHLDGEVKAALLQNKVIQNIQHHPDHHHFCFRAAVIWQRRGCTTTFSS